MSEVPLHRFISFQIWIVITSSGFIAGVLSGGLDTGIEIAFPVSFLGLLIGIAANELTEGSLTKGV